MWEAIGEWGSWLRRAFEAESVNRFEDLLAWSWLSMMERSSCNFTGLERTRLSIPPMFAKD